MVWLRVTAKQNFSDDLDNYYDLNDYDDDDNNRATNPVDVLLSTVIQLVVSRSAAD